MLFSLAEHDVRRLRDLLIAYEQGRLTAPPNLPAPLPAARINTYLAVATDTITAASGNTLGSGPVTIRQSTESGDDWVLSNSEVTDTAYNDGPDAIASGSQVKLIREPIGGRLLVVREADTSAKGVVHIYCLGTDAYRFEGGTPDVYLGALTSYAGFGRPVLLTAETVFFRLPNNEVPVEGQFYMCRQYGTFTASLATSSGDDPPVLTRDFYVGGRQCCEPATDTPTQSLPLCCPNWATADDIPDALVAQVIEATGIAVNLLGAVVTLTKDPMSVPGNFQFNGNITVDCPAGGGTLFYGFDFNCQDGVWHPSVACWGVPGDPPVRSSINCDPFELAVGQYLNGLSGRPFGTGCCDDTTGYVSYIITEP